MRAPIEEVTLHLCRERGDRDGPAESGDRRAGFPSPFSLDPTHVARLAQVTRHY